MAKEAERLLADTGWLPEPLRLDGPLGDAAQSDVAPAEASGESETLPEFLASDEEETPAEASDEPQSLAAE